MSFPPDFCTIEKENENSSSADNYLRYTKLTGASLQTAQRARQQVLVVWGAAAKNDSMKPFRFHEQPDQSDIDGLGSDYVQSMNYN